jgi:uncharacterized UPF0160 family protein
MEKKEKIVTHNGGFHADDCFAVATLLLHLGKEMDGVEIIRTRDTKLIEAGDLVVDVGGVHDPSIGRFDHHQTGGAGERANGIPYASFGLVWQEFGKEVAGSEFVYELIDNGLVSFVDAEDSGVNVVEVKKGGVSIYTIQRVIGSFDPGTDASEDELKNAFIKVVELAKVVLLNEIRLGKTEEGMREVVVRAYEEVPDKRIVVLDDSKGWNRALISEILSKFEEPMYFVREHRAHGWQTVAVGYENYVNRKDLPEGWAGKRDEELARVTGVDDAVFCHNGRFMCIAKTKEGAIALAKRALSS